MFQEPPVVSDHAAAIKYVSFKYIYKVYILFNKVHIYAYYILYISSNILFLEKKLGRTQELSSSPLFVYCSFFYSDFFICFGAFLGSWKKQ